MTDTIIASTVIIKSDLNNSDFLSLPEGVSSQYVATGDISGVVMDGTNPVENANVTLHHTQTRKMIASTFTDENGEYIIKNIPILTGNTYFAIVDDVEGGTNYNSMILSGLTPVA